MCEVPNVLGPRYAFRLAFLGLATALLAGCADSSRFIGDPLGNPFKSASAVPASAAPVGYGSGLGSSSLASPAADPRSYAPRSPIASQPLAPPPGLPSRNVAGYGASPRMASYEAPVHASPALSSSYRAPATERTGSIPAASGHGSWSPEGGMAVIAANGESAAVLGERYNVPTDALLRANGFSSAGEVRPGTRVIIPVYNAAGTAAPSRRAQSEPVPARKLARREPSSRREQLAARQETDRRDQAVKREQAAVHREAMMRGAAEQRETKQREIKQQEAKQQEVKQREAKQRGEPAKRERMAAAPPPPMHWVKGPAPKMAMPKLKPVEVADNHALRKAAKEQAVKDQAAGEAKPMRMAAVEEPARHAPTVDPTPTASLPPTVVEKPVAGANGNPEFRWPAHGRIIQGFKTGGNDGINIAVPEGTAVKAAESGVVAYAGNEIKGFGNLVLIRHPNGYVSAYANNGNIEVHRGEQVARGQTIAKSGQSGNVASPQLHFELRKGSTPVDPTRYLAGL